jgi:hypothetical protein
MPTNLAPSSTDPTISTASGINKIGSLSSNLQDGERLADVNTNSNSTLIITDKPNSPTLEEPTFMSSEDISTPRSENSINVDARGSELDVDFADTHQLQANIETITNIEERRQVEMSALEEQYKILQIQKEQLLIEIEEGRKILDALKDEMSRCGIESTDSPRFLNVVNTFRQYGYDPSKIMNALIEVVEIEDARNDIKLKLEVENDRKILDEKLENLGLGDLEQLKQIIVSIMTLESFGVGIDQIINLCKSCRLQNQKTFLDHQYLEEDGIFGTKGVGFE